MTQAAAGRYSTVPAAARREPWALYLAVAGFLLLGMRQSFTVPMTFGQSLAQFLLFGGAALWALTRLAGQRFPTGLRLLTCAMLFYVSATAISYANSSVRGVPPAAQTLADRYLFTDVVLLFLMFFVTTVVVTARDLDLVLKGLLAGATVSALFGLVQVATGVELAPMFRLPGLKYDDFQLVRDLTRGGLSRPQGSAGHPLELGAVLTVMVPIGIGLTLSARARGERWLLWAACTTVVAAGAAATVSRSAIIGTAVALLVMAWRWPIRRLAVIAAGALGVAVVGWLSGSKLFAALSGSFLGAATDSSVVSRTIGADYVAEHFADALVTGQGAGTYPALNQPVLDNQYFSRLMETGLLGLSSYLLLLAVAIWFALRASTRLGPELADTARAIAGALCALGLIGFILDSSGFAQMWFLTFLLIALSGVAVRLAAANGPDRT